MKVLVTGADGYIGSLLTGSLLRQGHDVTGLDAGFYRDGWLYSDHTRETRIPRLIDKDLRRVTAEDLEGFDAVVHLAELSNDPLGANSPDVTFAINHLGSVHLAKLAKKAGIRRFVYTSSCSVYGAAQDDWLTEESPVNPQTAYAECKVGVERDLVALADQRFVPVCLRNATAFGASPRMRFDIVLNNLAGIAWTERKIVMTSDGSPWRPIVHVLDICQVIALCLEAPAEQVAAQIFNVGSDEQNYRVREIAEIVGKVFPGCEVSFGPSGGDSRSYRVSFGKIQRHLPSFKCRFDAESGARQLRRIFERIDMDRGTFLFRPYTRLKQIEYLRRTGQLDDQFFWTPTEATQSREEA